VPFTKENADGQAWTNALNSSMTLKLGVSQDWEWRICGILAAFIVKGHSFMNRPITSLLIGLQLSPYKAFNGRFALEEIFNASEESQQ
jgi:hypothetical protein